MPSSGIHDYYGSEAVKAITAEDTGHRGFMLLRPKCERCRQEFHERAMKPSMIQDTHGHPQREGPSAAGCWMRVSGILEHYGSSAVKSLTAEDMDPALARPDQIVGGVFMADQCAGVLDLFGSPAGPMQEGGYEEVEEVTDLEPFFFDEAEAVADHQRRLRREEEALRQKKLFEYRLSRVIDYDPKLGGLHYTRFGFNDLNTCDPEEESPYGPMRNTDKVYKGDDDPELRLFPGVNVLSVKMVTLDDLEFPIHVYGTVVARDSLDCKCVYLFRRDEDQCQVINSESESLILAGPKRGLLLIDDTVVEIDLKIKDPRSSRGIDFSKGFLLVKSNLRLKKNMVDSKYLESKLSTVEVMYAVVKDAVEATISIEVIRGKFNGEITACTTSIPDSLVLHDSKLVGKRGGCGEGTIQLLRSVMTVDIEDMLIISAKTGDGKLERTTDFTPRVNSWDDDVITVGGTRMRVKVTWSTIY